MHLNVMSNTEIIEKNISIAYKINLTLHNVMNTIERPMKLEITYLQHIPHFLNISEQ